MDLVQNKDLLESLSYLVAILGGIFGGIYFFIKYFKEYEERIDEAFTGMWINEGCINFPDEETHSVELSLESIKRELSGIISVRKYDEETHWNGLSVIGKRFLHRSKIQIIHVRNGEVLNVAKAKLHLNNKELSWKLLKGTSDFFPKKTTLLLHKDDL